MHIRVRWVGLGVNIGHAGGVRWVGLRVDIGHAGGVRWVGLRVDICHVGRVRWAGLRLYICSNGTCGGGGVLSSSVRVVYGRYKVPFVAVLMGSS